MGHRLPRPERRVRAHTHRHSRKTEVLGRKCCLFFGSSPFAVLDGSALLLSESYREGGDSQGFSCSPVMKVWVLFPM